MTLTPAERLERLRAGRARLRASGGRVGGRPPYGFLSQGQNFVEHPDEAPVAWLMCHLYRQGWSLARIADVLEELGIPSRMGKHWGANVVRGVIIRNFTEEERRTAPRARPSQADQLMMPAGRAVSP